MRKGGKMELGLVCKIEKINKKIEKNNLQSLFFLYTLVII